MIFFLELNLFSDSVQEQMIPGPDDTGPLFFTFNLEITAFSACESVLTDLTKSLHLKYKNVRSKLTMVYFNYSFPGHWEERRREKLLLG